MPSPERWSIPGVAALLALVIAFFVVDVAPSWRRLDETAGDFGHYFHAARALRDGRSPYDVAGYDYPALVAFAVLPLAGRTKPVARRLWFMLNLSALLAAAVLTWASLGKTQVAGLATAAMWLIGGTVTENLGLGQVTPMLLFLLAATVTFAHRRPRLAGSCLGLATALKLWPATLAWAFLVRRQGRALTATVVTATLLLLAPIALLRMTTPPPYGPTTAGFWMGSPAPLNQSLPALALRLADPPRAGQALPHRWLAGVSASALKLPPSHAALSVTVALLLLVGGAAGVAAALRRHHGDQSTDQRALLALASLAILASPVSWYHYQLVQLLPLSAVFVWAWNRRAWLGAGSAALLLLVLTRFSQTSYGLYFERFGATAARPGALWIATSVVPLLGLLTVVWMVWRITGDRSPAGGHVIGGRGATIPSEGGPSA